MKTFLSLAVLLAFLALGVEGQAQCQGQMITAVNEIDDLVQKWNETITLQQRIAIEAEWAWASNLTDFNLAEKNKQNTLLAEKFKEVWAEAVCVDCSACTDQVVKRSVEFYNTIDLSALPEEDYKEYLYVQSTMEDIYGKATVCKPNGGECYPLEPELYAVLRESEDYCEQQWAWEGWRNESGRKIRGYFTSYVHLQNQAALANGFDHAKDMWTKSYLRDQEEFYKIAEDTWEKVKPLYQKLHAFVRGRLQKVYKDNKFPSSGHIPAHLLGNMWAQDWTAISKHVLPYPDAEEIDITALLEKNGTSRIDLYHIADDFFQSIGMDPMTEEFWQKSILLKPTDREMICHASAWDFYEWDDYRIKQCTEINQAQFQTVHHEMGHIQYFMHYKQQAIEFRNGGNPGFHEAIGDLIALSVMTPDHLKTIGLYDKDKPISEETYLNSMMNMALKKIIFLPFGYLMDVYRWDVFTKDVPFEDMNAHWWKLRSDMQGMSPPVVRSEDDFDPGAKYHTPASVPYIRYFFSHIAQFQFHKDICTKMGFTKDWHKCDIYNKPDETKAFREAMMLGQSVPYPEILANMTGGDTQMNAQALLDYFKPLSDFLDKELGNNYATWTPGSYSVEPNTCDYNKLNPVPPCPEPDSGSLSQVSMLVLAVSLLFAML